MAVKRNTALSNVCLQAVSGKFFLAIRPCKMTSIVLVPFRLDHICARQIRRFKDHGLRPFKTLPPIATLLSDRRCRRGCNGPYVLPPELRVKLTFREQLPNMSE